MGAGRYALLGTDVQDQLPGMFCISEAEAAAIRAAFEQGGELSTQVELRRLSPRYHQQHGGEGMCTDHRQLYTAAGCGTKDAAAAPQRTIPTCRLTRQRQTRLGQSG